MAATPGFEPEPHWWEASGLTTALSLAPSHSFIHLFGLHFTSYILLSIDRAKNEKTGVSHGVVSWCSGNHCWFALCCGVDIVQCLFNLFITSSGAPNEKIVQNHLNIALLNVF